MMQIEEIMRDRLKNDKGFTLIEVIAVLIIIAILTAVAISRGTGTDEAKLQAEVDTLKGHLRYAQYLALNDISSTTGYATPTKWGIDIGTNSYELVKYVSGTKVTPTPFNLPNESSPTHSFAPINATGTGTVLFNEWGSPDTPIPPVALGGQSITITAETGFIP